MVNGGVGREVTCGEERCQGKTMKRKGKIGSVTMQGRTVSQ